MTVEDRLIYSIEAGLKYISSSCSGVKSDSSFLAETKKRVLPVQIKNKAKISLR